MLISSQLPIIDLHCDLLVYLTDVPGSVKENIQDIGCALPALTQGNVKLQVMAIYCAAGAGSTQYASLQADMFKELAETDNCLTAIASADDLQKALQSDGTGMVAAIENAAGFCEEDEPLEDGFKKLEKIIDTVGRVLYISFTHHTANRFGGGNNTTTGITRDGKMLLDYLHGRKIAVDMSHTSDALAFDILHHIDTERLDIPVIASHSNFRPVWDHNRNLPDELTQEIIRRKGLIGMNFLRLFLHTDNSEALFDHIMYGFEHGAEDAICFGADYFYFADSPDKDRFPFYNDQLANAGISYAHVLNELQHKLTPAQLEKFSFRNAQNFIQRIWS